MIVAAGTLVVLGLAMFVAGLATGATAFFWGCVGVCVIAAVLLVVARRQLRALDEGEQERTAVPATAVVAAVTTERVAAGRGSGATRGADREAAESVHPTDELPAVPPSRVPEPALAEPATRQAPAVEAPAEPPPPAAAARPDEAGEPPLEEVEVTDLLLVVDLKDEVLVVDEHPRYHLPGCPRLAGEETIPLPLDEARTDGFTPCGVCAPDSTLAERERTRRHGG